LPSFCEYYLSPEVPYLDLSSSSSCFEENEDEYPIIEEVKNFHPDYLLLKQNHHQASSSKCSSLPATMGRLLAIACAFVLIGCRLRTMIVQKSDVSLFDGPADAVLVSATPMAPVTPAVLPLTTTTAAPTTTTTTTVSSSLTEVQLKSQALLLAKYGVGPYLVEFQLNIWGEDNRPVEHYFTVELAPSDLMPATVYFFLEQVTRGLWSETSFYENLEHVIVSRPVSGNGQLSKRQHFVDAGLSRPAVPEYSPYYFPHTPYTLGLSDNNAGGGDDAHNNNAGEPVTFYINKRHNVHHHRISQACFAQVVVGRSTVDQLAAMPGSDAGRIRPVEIKLVRRVQLTEMSPHAVQEYLLVKQSGR
jgi:Cyclophilin type peptidyl-prolyl cis-trans isomerase/CLD